MADLYHLLDEPLEVAQSVEEEEDAGSWNGHEEEVDVRVPLALQEAARRPYQQEQESPSKGISHDIADKLKRLDDPWSSSAKSVQQLQEELQELPYTQLYQAWLHECHAPDVLPYPEELLQPIREGLARYQAYMDECADGEDEGDTNENVTALIHSLLRVDAERVKFLVADLLRRRIQKITLHPQYYLNLSQTNETLLSALEMELLQEYNTAVARHLATTVTDHFPQAVWRSLEIPADQRDGPDPAAFCFIRCLEDVLIGEALQPAGACRVVRYQRIRSLLLEGKVELM
jgi:hypothetical protein